MTYTREMIKRLIDEMPEEKLEAFVTLFADKNAIARMECEDILAHPENYKWYDSAEEMWEDIFDDEEV